ncbi:endonuclease/exonuclease/phosphatase family protein [uncultured Algibacter sp.]|uniref:endonuclease/exonuclease/phosphatase family protein n=1 Tax=uncultured Algibacter sp. TaxID=298659 RepID=UPI003216ACFB
MNCLKLTLLILSLSVFATVNAQKKKFKIHTLAFYNVENLFDTINNPTKLDEFSPIMKIKSNRRKAYNSKINNMAKVIAEIGKDVTQNTPAIIGICEIENADVLEDLINNTVLQDKDYGIIHYDSPDVRGIDVALLFQKKLFTPINTSSHELIIHDDQNQKRIYTRNQLLVSGKLENDLIHIIVNHWPSRRGGEARSRPKRIAAARLSKRLVDSLQIIDPYSKIFIMGDLNDNPNNTSIKKILKAKNTRNVGLKGIYNPFETFFKKGLGTTAYRDSWSLFDQIMLTKPLLEKDYASYRFYKAGIFNKSYLINHNGKYKGYPFRSWSNGNFSNGFSDHFPVYVYVIKEIDTSVIIKTND